MKSSEIRKRFLAFFQERGHAVFPSSSLVPDDPTLLLTPAGMVQFKPVFQGEMKPTHIRITTCQKCVRTSDIERVGHTARHLTFFEMLGNFSFGDYYKREAIAWAWEFLTQNLKLDPGRMWITVFEDDDESFEIWRDEIGIPEARIVRMGEEDNFWSAGPTGPCGPCSELVYDLGEDRSCGRPDCGIHCDCDRFLEVWNLVFMEYNRNEKGDLEPLPKRNIDTGLGLERVASVLQDVPTNFETNLLKPIVDKTINLSGIRYGKDKKSDISVKIIADHVRAITFLIGDGVLPSNEGRGYILRRLIRRAVRHGRLLGIERSFLPALVQMVVESMKDAYPEIKESQEFIIRIAAGEEERFSQTLKSGLSILSGVIQEAKSKGMNQIGGDIVFQLYDTYGFPLELTREIAEEDGFSVDEREFDELMEEQRRKARAAWRDRVAKPKEVYAQVFDQYGKGEFVGYSLESVETTIQAIIRGNVVVHRAKEGDEIEVVLKKTPFYAEMGGQVGDKGCIEASSGTVEIVDTQSPFPDLYVHVGKVVKGTICLGQKAKATIDLKRRTEICRNHTATHLLHWALRTVLGKHVKQAGSLVDHDRLRFDFTHFTALSDEEIWRVEKLINDKVFEGHSVKCYITSFQFAKDIGAIALFGEKYGEFVRVVEIGNFSKELCGGIHVANTSQVGLVKIVSEGSIGTNLRRVEALTASRALDYIHGREEILEETTNLLKVGTIPEIPERITSILATLKEREREIESFEIQLIKHQVDTLLASTREVNGVRVLIRAIEAKDMESLRRFVDVLRERVKSGIMVLGASHGGKAMLIAAATPNLVANGFHAGDLLKEIAPLVGGGGGGRADLAQAGGRKPENISQALDKALRYIEKHLRKKVKAEFNAKDGS